METDVINNNKVYLQGVVQKTPEYSHTVIDEKFYSFMLKVPRLSGTADVLPILISEKLLAVNNLAEGNKIGVRGQFRSHNSPCEGKSKLILSIFCREVVQFKEEQNPNIIELDGFICKPPIYRTTPFSREICDVLVAVNRNFDKSDYLPCIAWGRNAAFVRTLAVGTELKLTGRIQSRNYEKKLQDGERFETRTAYEVSIANLSLVNLVNEEGVS